MPLNRDLDEGPSADDLARFGGDTAYCPNCGEEMWDLADRCPNCGEAVSTSARPPAAAWFRQRTIILIALIVLLAFAMTAIGFRVF